MFSDMMPMGGSEGSGSGLYTQYTTGSTSTVSELIEWDTGLSEVKRVMFRGKNTANGLALTVYDSEADIKTLQGLWYSSNVSSPYGLVVNITDGITSSNTHSVSIVSVSGSVVQLRAPSTSGNQVFNNYDLWAG